MVVRTSHSWMGYFFEAPRQTRQSLWFSRLLYLFVVFQCCTWFLQFDLLFGEHSVVMPGQGAVFFYQRPAFLLFERPDLAPAFLLMALLMAVCGLFFRARLSALPNLLLNALLWLLVLNLHNRLYAALTGGGFLLNQFLFFNCFLAIGKGKASQPVMECRYLLHNLAVSAIRLQLVLAYFLSGLAKLSDSGWLNGKALNDTTRVHHFFIQDGMDGLGTWGVFLNYLVMTYQLLFPLSLLPGGWKKPFLLPGILMHLYIAFFMGLVDFGLVMVIGYVFFWLPVRQTDALSTTE